MKKIYTIFMSLFLLSCSDVELIPASSLTVIEKINSYRGEKAVILNVWALWCVPCVEEFPMLVEFQKNNENLEVVFVSADFQDEFENVKSFLVKQGLKSQSFIKNEKDDIFINGINRQWSGSLPYIIVFSKNKGIVVDSWEGKEPKSRFELAIDIALSS